MHLAESVANSLLFEDLTKESKVLYSYDVATKLRKKQRAMS